MRSKFPLAIAALLTCLFVWSPVHGQSMPKEKQAEVAFDIRLDTLRGTPLYDMIKGNMNMAQASGPDIDIEKVNRVWGAVQLPETAAEMAGLGNMEPGSELPMELFARMVFQDSMAAKEAMNQVIEESKEVTKDGKTYYVPKGDDSPSNVFGHMLDENTIEFGTEGYLTGGAGEGVFSSGLTTAWGSFGEEPIRIAFDLDNARGLIDEGLEMAKQASPGIPAGMLDLFTFTNDMRIAIDLKDGGNILKVGMAGTNEEDAEKLNSGLNGLLALAKFSGGGAVENLRNADAEAADVLSKIINSLESTRDGTNVDISIPKPDGFDGAIKRLMEMNGGGADF